MDGHDETSLLLEARSGLWLLYRGPCSQGWTAGGDPMPAGGSGGKWLWTAFTNEAGSHFGCCSLWICMWAELTLCSETGEEGKHSYCLYLVLFTVNTSRYGISLYILIGKWCRVLPAALTIFFALCLSWALSHKLWAGQIVSFANLYISFLTATTETMTTHFRGSACKAVGILKILIIN